MLRLLIRNEHCIQILVFIFQATSIVRQATGFQGITLFVSQIRAHETRTDNRGQ